MSGAYLENLDRIHPGLNAILGNSTELRGTVKHIVDKSRRARKEGGLSALNVDQLLLMMAYYEGLAKKHDEKNVECKLTEWHANRMSIYQSELYNRGVDGDSHPKSDLFSKVSYLLWSRQEAG